MQFVIMLCKWSRLALSVPAGAHLGVSSSKGSMTSGLVGEMNHQVLPSIPPWLTMLLTLVAVMVG